MSVQVAQASNEYLTGIILPGATAPPFTVTMACRIVDDPSVGTWFAWNHYVSGSQQYRLSVRSSGNYELRVRAGGADDFGTTGAVQDEWAIVTIVLRTVADRSIYVNGGNRENSTTSISPTTPTSFTIGGSTLAVDAWSGEIADVAIWPNVILADSEVAQLGRWRSPLFVRPLELGFYATLFGGPGWWFDCIGGQLLTETGTPELGQEPPTIYPAGFDPGTRNIVRPAEFMHSAYRRTYFGKAGVAVGHAGRLVNASRLRSKIHGGLVA